MGLQHVTLQGCVGHYQNANVLKNTSRSFLPYRSSNHTPLSVPTLPGALSIPHSQDPHSQPRTERPQPSARGRPTAGPPHGAAIAARRDSDAPAEGHSAREAPSAAAARTKRRTGRGRPSPGSCRAPPSPRTGPAADRGLPGRPARPAPSPVRSPRGGAAGRAAGRCPGRAVTAPLPPRIAPGPAGRPPRGRHPPRPGAARQ